MITYVSKDKWRHFPFTALTQEFYTARNIPQL